MLSSLRMATTRETSNTRIFEQFFSHKLSFSKLLAPKALPQGALGQSIFCLAVVTR